MNDRSDDDLYASDSSDVIPPSSSPVLNIETNIAQAPTAPATSPTSYLGNQSLYMSNKDFFIFIQDRGNENIDYRTNKPFNC